MRALLFFFALLAMTTGSASGDRLDPRWYPHYQEYLTKGHYRAFAATFPSFSGGACACGYSWYRPTVEDAIEAALENCKKSAREYVNIGKCRIYAIGNIVVLKMKRKEFESVKEFYRLQPTASEDEYKRQKLGLAPKS